MSPSLLPLLQVNAFLLIVVSACIRCCDPNNSTQNLKWMYHHTATEIPKHLCCAKTSWTPALPEVFVFPSFLFFWFFFHKVGHHQSKKSDGFWFSKKIQTGSEVLKSPKNDPKIRFLWFWQKSYPFRYAFLLHYESANGLSTFGMTTCLGRIWYLSYGPKTSRPIRMQDVFNSQISWGIYEVEFLDVTRVP